jgi:ubiquinone biosynthesis protein
MVVVEGVARTLNPDLNIWVTAEPVVRGWIERQLGPLGKLEEATGSLGRLVFGLPTMLEEAHQATSLLSTMAKSGGLRLDAQTTTELALINRRGGRWTRLWLAVGALSLLAIALKLVT